MIDTGTMPDEKIKTKDDLLKYCCNYTLAMVKIRAELTIESGLS